MLVHGQRILESPIKDFTYFRKFSVSRLGAIVSNSADCATFFLKAMTNSDFGLVSAIEHSKNKNITTFENKVGPGVLQTASYKHRSSRIVDSKDRISDHVY